MSEIQFWVPWLEDKSPKSVEDWSAKHCKLTKKDLNEEGKHILKLLFLTWGQVLREKQMTKKTTELS